MKNTSRPKRTACVKTKLLKSIATDSKALTKVSEQIKTLQQNWISKKTTSANISLS